MSDSTPKPQRRRSTERRRLLSDSGWMLLSALLHLSFVGVALLFPPVRDVLLQSRTPDEPAEIRIEGEELAEIVELIRDINRDELEMRAVELEEIRREMTAIQHEQEEEYGRFTAEEAVDAAKRALEEQQRALTAQETIITAQQQARATPDDRGGQELIQQQQFVVESAQMEVSNRMAMAVPALPSNVKDEQTRANTEQSRAVQTQEDLHALSRGIQERRGTVAGLTRELDKNRVRQDAAQKDVQETEAAQREARQQAETAATAAEQAKETKDARAIRNAESKLRQARQMLTSSETKLDRVRKSLEEARQRTQAAQNKFDEGNRALTQAQQQVSRKQQTAEQAQLAARKAQEKARDALAKLLETRRPAVQEAGTAAESTSPPPAEEYPDLSAMNLARLYKHSAKSEVRIADVYKEIRSTELAQVRGISREEARQITDVPRPVRPTLDEKLLQARVATAPEYHKHSEQIQTALRETQAMVSLGENMLELARELRRKNEEGVSVALAAANDTRQMERMAHEIAGGKVADLAGLMAKAAGGAMKPGGDDIKSKSAEPDNHPPPKHAALPPKIPAPKDLRLTRQILPIGGDSGWVAVDTWYTIGPFPNPNRANIHRRFPPETVVDLDASYVGKDNRVLRWIFAQAGEPEVRPYNEEEYGIWYAFTELRFDEARDLWIAVGSDDRSDIWINGQRVWSSSDILKSWAIDEGFRRVHFERGINRILYRIENGWHTVAFSLCLYTGAS